MLQQLRANGLVPQSCRRLLACHRPQQMRTHVALSSVARAGHCTAHDACDALEAIRPCINLTTHLQQDGGISLIVSCSLLLCLKLCMFLCGCIHVLQQLRANGLVPQSCRRLLACHRPQQMPIVVI